jgi:hypothetical protein
MDDDGRLLDSLNLCEEEDCPFLSSPSGDNLNLPGGEGLGGECSGLLSPLKLGFSLLD